jgi:hypothetical protein
MKYTHERKRDQVKEHMRFLAKYISQKPECLDYFSRVLVELSCNLIQEQIRYYEFADELVKTYERNLEQAKCQQEDTKQAYVELGAHYDRVIKENKVLKGKVKKQRRTVWAVIAGAAATIALILIR